MQIACFLQGIHTFRLFLEENLSPSFPPSPSFETRVHPRSHNKHMDNSGGDTKCADSSCIPGPPKSTARLVTGSPSNQMVAMHNPIQLAAISNYKLAQLTFAPPDQDSMRKTALVKNMLEVLYEDTPPEWLSQMTRWVFFTPEYVKEYLCRGWPH